MISGPEGSPVAVDLDPAATGDTTPRRIFRYALAAVTGAAVTTVVLLVALAGEQDRAEGVRPQSPSASTQATQQQVADLMEAHDCWRGDAPAGVAVPNHVVVTLADGRTVYGARFLTGQALEQLFGGVDHGLKVWGFCR